MAIYSVIQKPVAKVHVKFNKRNVGGEEVVSGIKYGIHSFSSYDRPDHPVTFIVNKQGDSFHIKARRAGLKGIIRSTIFGKNGINRFDAKELEEHGASEFWSAFSRAFTQMSFL